MPEPAYPVTTGTGGNTASVRDPGDDLAVGIITIVDLEGYQGDDRPLVIPLDDADGNPLPLHGEGWRADAQVRRHPTPMSPTLHTWTTHPREGERPRARWVELDDPAADDDPDRPARWGLELAVDDSRSWDWCGIPAGWDLLLTDPDGRGMPVAGGHCYWHPTYTWPTPAPDPATPGGTP